MAETMTTTNLTQEMATFYDKQLIANAEAVLVHNQFGQKRPIPKNGGKTIHFRRFNPLPKATDPLVEGVTPDGSALTVSTVEATVRQYGDYITTSDLLELTAIDNVVVENNTVLGIQAGETLDAITADVLNAGTNVQYAGGKTSRTELTATDVITVEDIRKAVRTLKRYKAQPLKGGFVAIVHPDVAFDLMQDKEWLDVKTYADPKDLYNGEIGKLYGVRFVETTEAKIFPAESGKNTIPVYSTLVLGANAYGITDVTGGGLKMIAKPKGSAGSADPLDQRSTQGWKASHVAERLVEEFMVRIESASSYTQ